MKNNKTLELTDLEAMLLSICSNLNRPIRKNHVRGLIRPLWSPKNIGVLIDYLKSKRQVRAIIRDFRPMVAVGVGGYASGATLDAAASMGIPCLIQEQNSYAGMTNKHLAAKAEKICVAYDGMERFFPADKIVKTGNPVRQALLESNITREEALATFEIGRASCRERV